MKGIFTKEQHERLGQIGDDLIDFKKVFDKPIVGQAAEAVDGLFFKGITIGIDDYGLDKLPEAVKEEARGVVNAIMNGDNSGDYGQVPALAGKTIASINGIGEHEKEETEFATKGLLFLISGIKLWVAIKRSKKPNDEVVDG